MGHQTSKHRRSSGPAQPPPSKTQELAAMKSEQSITVRKYDLSNFAVIAVIFNPVKYKSRYNHYHKFEAHMSQSGVNLYTVECIFLSTETFGLPAQKFEITRASNPRHIQMFAPSILWMKENLINVAIKRLPENIEYIAWVDADIEFENLNWPHLTIAELQRYPIVQLFELSFFLGPGGKTDILRRDYSFGYSIRHNKPIHPKQYDEWYAHPGYAWAMRRSAIIAIGGLLDFCIVGSGDLHFAYALLHRIEETFPTSLHQDYQQLAITWGNRVAQVAQNGTNVGYIPINLWHHWHGERKDRHYVDRWAILQKHQFSPLNDLEKNNETGIIRLTDKTYSKDPKAARLIQALERDIVAYFQSRNEDNNAKSIPRQPPPLNKPKPVIAGKTQTHRSTGFKPSAIPSNKWGGGSRSHIWTSGPAGSHVDDHNPYLDQCSCPGHHHHPDNHHCPCSHHHMDDPQCWNPSEQEHSHHHHDYHPDTGLPSDDHHHHHNDTDHHFEEHHSSHGHEHHGGWDNNDHSGHHVDHSSGGGGFDNTDYGGHNFDHSSGGGGFDNTDYGGHGSFY